MYTYVLMYRFAEAWNVHFQKIPTCRSSVYATVRRARYIRRLPASDRRRSSISIRFCWITLKGASMNCLYAFEWQRCCFKLIQSGSSVPEINPPKRRNSWNIHPSQCSNSMHWVIAYRTIMYALRFCFGCFVVR